MDGSEDVSAEERRGGRSGGDTSSRRSSRTLRTTLEMIKFSHTLFALPFALLSAVLAARGIPRPAVLLKILLAMVGARSAAMAHNRLVDREIDAANPRTATRALPAGKLSVAFVRVFFFASVAVFLAAAASLNRLTLLLSPVALALLLFYSYTKRFTACRTWSSASASRWRRWAPGSRFAARSRWTPILLGLAVLVWTAGFDILYSLQDEEHDRRAGLKSIPARPGHAPRARPLGGPPRGDDPAAVRRLEPSGGGALFAIGIVATAAALLYQHAILKPGDLSRINTAFFTANGFVSLTLAALRDRRRPRPKRARRRFGSGRIRPARRRPSRRRSSRRGGGRSRRRPGCR